MFTNATRMGAAGTIKRLSQNFIYVVNLLTKTILVYLINSKLIFTSIQIAKDLVWCIFKKDIYSNINNNNFHFISFYKITFITEIDKLTLTKLKDVYRGVTRGWQSGIFPMSKNLDTCASSKTHQIFENWRIHSWNGRKKTSELAC